mmetsp:Transcript_3192/g.7220  ORF Transcript_3192/g.7220 Transcript_3192/m.7220 type:complete len:236 (+) Transcript_3192:837-1544(+)
MDFCWDFFSFSSSSFASLSRFWSEVSRKASASLRSLSASCSFCSSVFKEPSASLAFFSRSAWAASRALSALASPASRCCMFALLSLSLRRASSSALPRLRSASSRRASAVPRLCSSAAMRALSEASLPSSALASAARAASPFFLSRDFELASLSTARTSRRASVNSRVLFTWLTWRPASERKRPPSSFRAAVSAVAILMASAFAWVARSATVASRFFSFSAFTTDVLTRVSMASL